MKCPRCQREVNDENAYCPYCGAKLPHHDNPAEKELLEMRKNMFLTILHRIMNISTIVAVVFAIIGLFGPVISVEGGTATLDIGGLYWFSFEGWYMLRDGQLSIGPFITTFILYLLTLGGIISLSAYAITRAINSIRRREECKTVPHIVGITIIHRIYSAFVSCFYYESVYNNYYEYETGSGWGETVFNVAIPLFIIALIVYLIGRATFTRKPKVIISRVFSVISAFTLLGSIGMAFACLGFQDLNIPEQVVYGTLHYFEVANVPSAPAVFIFLMFGLGILLIASFVALGVTVIRDLVKSDSINRKRFLALAITSAAIGLLMFIINIAFGAVVNQIDGYGDNIFHLGGNILGIFAATQFVLGLAIATSCIKEDAPVDENIIDAEVIEKEE